MSNNLEDMEFMMPIQSYTRDLILKFYAELEGGENKQNLINSFKDIQQSLSKESYLEKFELADNTPHKKCFNIFKNNTMNEDNMGMLRLNFLQLKKEFESMI